MLLTHYKEKHLRERLDGIMQDQLRIGAIIRQHTNLNEEEVSELFREARTKDADYAKRIGIVNDIRDINIPAGSPIISLVFQR